MPGEAQCVKVAIRCRPPSKKEIANNEDCIVELTQAFEDPNVPGEVILSDPAGHEEPGKFAFDIVFGLDIEQYQVYEAIGRPAMLKTFEGYNGTIFAYGQTGSGKSWSMGGAPDPPELRGITPRMNDALFEKIKEESVGTKRFLVMCSYFEIYNEIIFDLLNPVADRGKLGGGLQIKEHPVLGIYVKDLTEIVAENSQKLEDLLDNGTKNRAVSSTNMNGASSRSHSIFSIKVHQKDDDDPTKSVFAKLSLVDLAGSERQKGTGATGQTLKEGANINKSLSALGNVINALVESANGKKVFIPYRNSKLTRVLQESLGGNSLCTMLATLSPAACNYEETMSTLRYANRAKAIKVSATKNEEASQISRLKAEVEELKKKLESSGSGVGGAAGLTEAEKEAEKQKFEQQLKDMQGMMSSNWDDKAKLSEEHDRRMLKLREERRIAAQVVEEERARRLKLLQEKNDLELSIRALIDFVLHLPKFEKAPTVLTGELPRQWLKMYRTSRQQLDELKEQNTLMLVFKHGFDEDVKLWGESSEAADWGLAATGLNRSLLKLEKLRKATDKLLQLESLSLSSASEMRSAVKGSLGELEKFKEGIKDEHDGKQIEKANAVEEVHRMLALVLGQVQAKIDELAQLASVEMAQTPDFVLQFSQGVQEEAQALQAMMADPSLAAMPVGMPAKPLREYGAEDVSDTPETTEALLGQLIRWEGLCAKSKKSPADLLGRPPPKFLLDVAKEVKEATGFPPNFAGDWPDAREEKVARLVSLVDAVSVELGVALDFFDPENVLKGKEVPKTLRLLQLLGVAAARHLPADAVPGPGGAPGSAPALPPGMMPARQLPAILHAMGRCIKASKVQVDLLKANAVAAGDMGADAVFQEQLAELERQLEEAKSARRKQEEAIADAERHLEETRAEAKQVQTECELTAKEDAAGDDPELLELDRQVQLLTEKISAPGSLAEDYVLDVLGQQIEEMASQLERDASDVKALNERREELDDSIREADNVARRLEADIDRENQRREADQELLGQSPEEQRLILEAHEQKLRTRAGTLEAQIGVMHIESEDRKQANAALISESKELAAMVEDVNLQIQIVTEERDALREAEQQVWHEKTLVEEEVENLQQGYIFLSERLSSKDDEIQELSELLQQHQSEVAGLQKNGFDMSCSIPSLS